MQDYFGFHVAEGSHNQYGFNNINFGFIQIKFFKQMKINHLAIIYGLQLILARNLYMGYKLSLTRKISLDFIHRKTQTI